MTSTTLVRRYPYDISGGLAWLDHVSKHIVTNHHDLVKTEFEMHRLRKEVLVVHCDHDPDNDSPAMAVTWDAFDSHFDTARSQMTSNWNHPFTRLSAQSAALSCWVKFFGGSPVWEPVLFDCDTVWYGDIRSFLRVSTVSSHPLGDFYNWVDRVAIVAPRWFHQLLVTSCEYSLSGSRLRTQEGLFFDAPDINPYVGFAIPVPSSVVLANTIALWNPNAAGGVYEPLASAVAAAQCLQ